MSYGILKNKIAVYTALFGAHDHYDRPKPGDYDVFLATDFPGGPPRWFHGRANGFVPAVIPPDVSWGSLDDTRRARFWKLNSHLPCNPVHRYEYSLWVDAAFTLDKVDVPGLVKKYLAEADIAVCRHFMFSCTYEGGQFAIDCGKDDPGVVSSQLEKYRGRGYPANAGLAETGILLRRHTPKVAEFNAYWWRELASGSKRDQVSFNYCADTSGVRVAYFDGFRGDELGFLYRGHCR